MFVRYAGDEPPGSLMLVTATGGGPSALGEGEKEDAGRFSPSGTRIATAADGVVQILDATSGGVVSSIAQAGFLSGPAWSPDGAWIVYSSSGADFRANLFLSPADGSVAYQVTNTAENEITVDWGASPG